MIKLENRMKYANIIYVEASVRKYWISYDKNQAISKNWTTLNVEQETGPLYDY